MPETQTTSVREALHQGMVDDQSTSAVTPTSTEKNDEPKRPAREDGETVGLGDVDPTLVRDLEAELSKLPPEQRKVVEPLVAKFRQNYDKGFHRALARVGEVKRQMEAELERSKQVPPQSTPAVETVKQELRGFNRRLQKSTDPVERESIREAIHDLEETVEDVVKRILGPTLKPLEDKLKIVEESSKSERSVSVSAEIDTLEDEQGYPSSLIEKYRAQLLEAGMRYPQVEMEEILVKVVPWNELKPFLTQRTKERPVKVDTPSKSPASVSATMLPETDMGKFKDSDGRVNVRRLLHAMVKRST